MKPLKTISPGSASAFTLIEVLVASAVLSIVMMILLGTLSTSMALWRTTEGRLSADREGRAAELLFSQDVANAVLTTNTNLWPRVQNGWLQFLTTKPLDYQDPSGSDTGDVCLVEYSVDPTRHALVRNFTGSSGTWAKIKDDSLPPPPGSSSGQLLALNVFKDLDSALRGTALSASASDQPKTNFVILGTNMTATPSPSQANPPTAILVNVGVGDLDSIVNEDLLSNQNYKPRNANFFTFRLPLPRIPSQ